jgi:hypothetical protein
MASDSTQAEDDGAARMQTTQTTPTRLPLAIVFPRLGVRFPPPTAGAPGWPPAGRISLVLVAMTAAATLVRVGWVLEPGAGVRLAVVLSVGLVAWVLYPQPQTGFRIDFRPVDEVAAGDWVADGFWALRVASRTLAPADSGQRWRLTFADGRQVDLAEGATVRLAQPLGEVTTAGLPLAARIRSIVVLELLLWGWMAVAPFARTFSIWLVRFLTTS